MTRDRVLRLYARIFRIARQWEAQDPKETEAERAYIRREAQQKFHDNKEIKEEEQVRVLLDNAEARITIAEHYRIPYERPPYLKQGTAYDVHVADKNAPETRLARRSAIDRETPELQRLFRFYFASSALALELELSPLLSLDESTLDRLFDPEFVAHLPLKPSFQKLFLKKAIDFLTKHNIHSDSLYQSLCLAMAAPNGPFYRHFFPRGFREAPIVMQERPEAIVDGTTGLSSWLASYVLANHLLQCEQLDGQRVIELGAGCGLAGIAAARFHRLAHLWTTDCDPQVLQQLEANVGANFDGDSRATIAVQRCDFGDARSLDLLPKGVDLILAADVVYDAQLSEFLVAAFAQLAPCRMLVAAAERNAETLEHFRRLLESAPLTFTTRCFAIRDARGEIERTDEPNAVGLRPLIPPSGTAEKIVLFDIRLSRS
ncbi:EF-hand domain-containing protein [Aphelenchoides fujianensis]|nr:EF-hand domain-containing protein [Aphelenchoides fujianensis]